MLARREEVRQTFRDTDEAISGARLHRLHPPGHAYPAAHRGLAADAADGHNLSAMTGETRQPFRSTTRPVGMNRRRATVALLVMLAMTACARGTGADATATTTPPGPTATTPGVKPIPTVPASESPMTSEVPASILDQVLADANARTDVPVDEIEVMTAEAVTWPDGSLGCPEPGMMYTQALVDGYQVVLRAGDESLDYRVGNAGSFRLCEGPGSRGG